MAETGEITKRNGVQVGYHACFVCFKFISSMLIPLVCIESSIMIRQTKVSSGLAYPFKSYISYVINLVTDSYISYHVSMLIDSGTIPAIMEMFNKFKSTVGGLIGNPVTREFEVGPHIASAGPGHLWRIYEGTKKTSKQKVSLFYLEKKYLDRFARKDRDKILETLKKGPTKLTRLRHPNLLTVEHPLEESR